MASNISDTHAFPFSAVGLVADTLGGSASHGSGVLIAPDELLTAAHVVFKQGVGSASSIFVVPDLNGSDTPFGASIAVTDYHYFSLDNAGGVLSPVATQADFALLHLAQPITGAGVMVPVANFAGGTVHATGYPDASGVSSMVDVVESISQISSVSAFASGTDPGSGTSGGPLWASVGGTAQVYGLVSTGGFGSTASAFSGTTLNIINGWIAADHAGGLSGAIAVAVPKVLHAITTEAAPAGVNAAEATLFDTFSYKSNNLDVANSGMDPLSHFAQYGWHENRAPDPLFDVAFYLAHNSDVAAAGIDPLAHYAQFGWKEGRDPSASFSTSGYLAANSDVKLAGIDPLQHYLTWGVAEGRSL